MAYVPIPKDLKKVKTKVAFNLTKRQLIGFTLAGGCREKAAIKEGGVTQNESLLPKFLHKKRWLTITIFLRYML